MPEPHCLVNIARLSRHLVEQRSLPRCPPQLIEIDLAEFDFDTLIVNSYFYSQSQHREIIATNQIFSLPFVCCSVYILHRRFIPFIIIPNSKRNRSPWSRVCTPVLHHRARLTSSRTAPEHASRSRRSCAILTQNVSRLS